MGDVRNIHGDVIVSERGCNDECVEALEALLEQARSGEIVSVIAAVQYSDGGVGTLDCGIAKKYPMAGALMALVNKLTGE